MKFSEIFAWLVEWHGIHETKRIALTGRIKRFQRLGWPRGVNVGRGQRVDYTFEQFADIFFLFEFTAMGFTAERAIIILEANRERLHLAAETGEDGVDIILPLAIGEGEQSWTVCLHVPTLKGGDA